MISGSYLRKRSLSLTNLFVNVFNAYSAHFRLKFLKKKSVISLYWFAIQQQTSTFKHQTND